MLARRLAPVLLIAAGVVLLACGLAVSLYANRLADADADVSARYRLDCARRWCVGAGALLVVVGVVVWLMSCSDRRPSWSIYRGHMLRDRTTYEGDGGDSDERIENVDESDVDDDDDDESRGPKRMRLGDAQPAATHLDLAGLGHYKGESVLGRIARYAGPKSDVMLRGASRTLREHYPRYKQTHAIEHVPFYDYGREFGSGVRNFKKAVARTMDRVGHSRDMAARFAYTYTASGCHSFGQVDACRRRLQEFIEEFEAVTDWTDAESDAIGRGIDFTLQYVPTSVDVEIFRHLSWVGDIAVLIDAVDTRSHEQLLDDDGFDRFVATLQNLPRVVSLHINMATDITPDNALTGVQLSRIAIGLPGLSKLHVTGVRDVTPDHMTTIGRMPALKGLGLSGCELTDAHLASLAQTASQHAQLHRLIILDNPAVTEDGLRALASISSLTVVRLSRLRSAHLNWLSKDSDFVPGDRFRELYARRPESLAEVET